MKNLWLLFANNAVDVIHSLHPTSQIRFAPGWPTVTIFTTDTMTAKTGNYARRRQSEAAMLSILLI